MNAYAQLLIAVYLTLVLIRGNENNLSTLLIAEGGFLKWAIALLIVIAVTDSLGKPGRQFMVLVWVALIMTAVSKNQTLLQDILKIIEG